MPSTFKTVARHILCHNSKGKKKTLGGSLAKSD